MPREARMCICPISALPHNLPPQRLEHADNLASAENGKRRRHYAATSTCRVSMVKGIPRSARTWRHW